MAVLTRKYFYQVFFTRITGLFLLGILLIAVVSACSQKIDQYLIRSKQPAKEECRLVKHFMGETCIPIHPERIITLWPDILGNSLALGIKPVGATGYLMEFSESPFLAYMEHKVDGVEFVGSFTEPNFEKILLLKPDLILTNSWAEKTNNSYKKLTWIAPTVVLDFPEPAQRDWRKLLKDLAIALDKTKEADTLIDEYKQRIEKLKQALGDGTASLKENRRHQLQVSVANTTSGLGIWAYGEKHPVGVVLNDIGLQRPPAQRGNFYYINHISEERLSDIDGDVLFFLYWGSKDAKKTLEKLQKKPLWRQLKAVQQNQVYFVDAGYWHSIDILAINAIIDDLFKYLINTH